MAKYINSKAILLALTTSLALTLFLGCFANAPANMDASFAGENWTYLNRGYPVPWAGLSLVGDQVKLPLVQAPFLSEIDGSGNKFVKIIHLGRVIPAMLLTFAVMYIPSFLFTQAMEKNKKLLPLFTIMNFAAVAAGVYIYFSLFPRI